MGCRARDPVLEWGPCARAARPGARHGAPVVTDDERGATMQTALLILHVTLAATVVGVLFAQSLLVVMALRLRGEGQRQGVRIVQRRLHGFVYYPLLAVTLLSGAWLAWAGDAFAQGSWLRWKLVAVVLLIGLGLLTGQALHTERPARGLALAVHVAILALSAAVLGLAVLKPF